MLGAGGESNFQGSVGCHSDGSGTLLGWEGRRTFHRRPEPARSAKTTKQKINPGSVENLLR